MTGRFDLRGHPEALFECDSGCEDKPIQSLGTLGSPHFMVVVIEIALCGC